MEWSQVPEFWQQLKYLSIWGCTRGLTMPILSEIIPQMKSLQTLILPTSTTLNELEHFHEIVSNFSGRIRISDKPMGPMFQTIFDRNFGIHQFYQILLYNLRHCVLLTTWSNQ